MLRATQKRRHFALRLAITQLAFLGAVLALNAWIGPNPIPTKLVPVITKYTLILCIAVWGVMFCYEAAIGAALINVATAFCVEHIAQRVKSLVLRYLPHDKSGEIALLYALTAVFVFLFWRVFEKPIDRRNNSPRKTGFLQVFVSGRRRLHGTSFTAFPLSTRRPAPTAAPWSPLATSPLCSFPCWRWSSATATSPSRKRPMIWPLSAKCRATSAYSTGATRALSTFSTSRRTI